MGLWFSNSSRSPHTETLSEQKAPPTSGIVSESARLEAVVIQSVSVTSNRDE